MNYIEIKNLSKKYGKKVILSEVNFTAQSGECIGIVGANGCGKSTLLKILAGVIKPDCGSIVYDGNNLLTHKKLFSSYFGYVPQDNALFENLTVADNLKLWYCDSTHNLKEDIKSGLIHEFGLSDYLKYNVKNLSGGTKKRLSIVCALAKDPHCLILDEPGASLDIVCKNDIMNYMKKYISKGNTIIIASHEEGELSVCTRKLLLMDHHLSPLANDISMSELMGKLVKVHD